MTVAHQPNPPNVSFNAYFETERVIIGLYWIQQPDESLVSYRVHAVASSTNITYSAPVVDNRKANLSLTYNTPYTVSVVADFCGERNSTTLIEVKYRELISNTC